MVPDNPEWMEMTKKSGENKTTLLQRHENKPVSEAIQSFFLPLGKAMSHSELMMSANKRWK